MDFKLVHTKYFNWFEPTFFFLFSLFYFLLIECELSFCSILLQSNPIDVEECLRSANRLKEVVVTLILIGVVVAQVMAYTYVSDLGVNIDQ